MNVSAEVHLDTVQGVFILVGNSQWIFSCLFCITRIASAVAKPPTLSIDDSFPISVSVSADRFLITL